MAGRAGIPVVVAGLWLAGCTTVDLAPGAQDVRLTRTAAEVAACAVVGNVHVTVRADDAGDLHNATNTFRNQVVGLGGNAGFVTEGGLAHPLNGVAYRCP